MGSIGPLCQYGTAIVSTSVPKRHVDEWTVPPSPSRVWGSVALGASHWASQLTPTTAPTWVAHPMCRPTASGGWKRMSAWRWPRSGLGAHGTIAGWPCCTVAAWLRCAFKASSRPPRSKLAHIACTTTACGSSALSQSERPLTARRPAAAAALAGRAGTRGTPPTGRRWSSVAGRGRAPCRPRRAMAYWISISSVFA